MSSNAFDKAFWLAVDDMNAGQVEDPRRYLELVPNSERGELARLLATVLASRGPVGLPQRDEPGYERAVAAVDEVLGTRGPSGMLPPALQRLRKVRRISVDVIIDRLATEFEIGSEEGRKELERFYHRLESGRLLGSRLTRRVIAAIAGALDGDTEDFLAASTPTGEVAGPALMPAMGRGSGDAVSLHSERTPVEPHPEVRLVETLFTGGRDA